VPVAHLICRKVNIHEGRSGSCSARRRRDESEGTKLPPNCLLEFWIMKPFNFKSKRLEVFCALLILGGVFYVVDCLVVILFKHHQEVPWFERGIYAGGPVGFFWTAATIVCAFGYLILGKGK
jgi:hypothetical protein